MGFLLNEVGNLDFLITPEGKRRLEDVLVSAFEEIGATEHGLPQFFWSDGETMAAFKADVEVS